MPYGLARCLFCGQACLEDVLEGVMRGLELHARCFRMKLEINYVAVWALYDVIVDAIRIMPK